MSAAPFMPLWVSDFVGDTLDLDAKEIGAYMLLLMAMWGRDGTLPNDQKKLQRVARCGRDWHRVWSSLEPYFTVEDDTITQLRLRKELQKVAAKREVNAQSGSLGGRAKALKSKEMGLANASDLLKQPEPYPEPELKKGDTNVSLVRAPLFSGRDFSDFWDAYPHRNGKKKNRHGAEAAFARAIKAGATVAEIAAGVEAMRADPDVMRGFARDPTTWLNQKGWTDEISETGGENVRSDNSQRYSKRHSNGPDPASQQILRLAGVGAASGDDRA